jgi:hypothetical protein
MSASEPFKPNNARPSTWFLTPDTELQQYQHNYIESITVLANYDTDANRYIVYKEEPADDTTTAKDTIFYSDDSTLMLIGDFCDTYKPMEDSGKESK